MGRKLTKDEIKAKAKYQEFFKRFKEARGIAYSALISRPSDINTLSNFINGKTDLRVSVSKLESLRKEMITNFKKVYEDLKDLLDEDNTYFIS